MLRSQEVRKLAPEMDPLRMGMGWTAEDLEKPQILIESTFGDSHPGSAHLLEFVELGAKGVKEAVQQDGFLGILTGGLKATAGGIAAAIISGLTVSLIFKAKDKS